MKIIDTNFDLLTGKTTITERDETAAETKARLDNAKEVAAAQAEAKAKAEAKAAAQAKLAALGLTVNDLQALGL